MGYFRRIKNPFYEPQLPLRVVPFEGTFAIVDSMGAIIAEGMSRQVAEEFLEHQDLLGQALLLLRDWIASDAQYFHDFRAIRSPDDDAYNKLTQKAYDLLTECEIKIPKPKTKVVDLNRYGKITDIEGPII